VKEYLLGEGIDGLQRLQTARVIADIRYRRLL